MNSSEGERDHWKIQELVDSANRHLRESRELLLRIADRRRAASPGVASPFTYFVYQDAIHMWRWTLEGTNGRLVAQCGEGYFNRQDCLNAVAAVATSGDASVYFRSDAGGSARL